MNAARPLPRLGLRDQVANPASRSMSQNAAIVPIASVAIDNAWRSTTSACTDEAIEGPLQTLVIAIRFVP